jgi:hypothetical protein
VNFAWARNSKTSNKPTLITTHPEIEPNDTGISAILTIGTMMTRVKFFADPDPMGCLLKQVAGAYILDEQRSSLCDLLKKEIGKLPMTSSTRKRRGWFSGDTPTTVTPANKTTTGPAFNALRRDIENNALRRHLNVTPDDPKTPPRVPRYRSFITDSFKKILNPGNAASPAKKPSVSFREEDVSSRMQGETDGDTPALRQTERDSGSTSTTQRPPDDHPQKPGDQPADQTSTDTEMEDTSKTQEDPVKGDQADAEAQGDTEGTPQPAEDKSQTQTPKASTPLLRTPRRRCCRSREN